jgi:hypothetical protein
MSLPLSGSNSESSTPPSVIRFPSGCHPTESRSLSLTSMVVATPRSRSKSRSRVPARMAARRPSGDSAAACGRLGSAPTSWKMPARFTQPSTGRSFSGPVGR